MRAVARIVAEADGRGRTRLTRLDREAPPDRTAPRTPRRRGGRSSGWRPAADRGRGRPGCAAVPAYGRGVGRAARDRRAVVHRGTRAGGRWREPHVAPRTTGRRGRLRP